MRKLLFISRRPFYPDSSGGGQHSALYLFKSLKARGWQIEVICSRQLKSPFLLPSTLKSIANFKFPYPAIYDYSLGYSCWRMIQEWNTKDTWLSFLEKRLQKYNPDMVLGHCIPRCFLLNYACDSGYPTFYFTRCADHFQGGAKISEKIHLLANSPFTASTITQTTGREAEVVLPFVDIEQYRVNNHQHKYITFINPIPEKGLNIVLEIVRLLPQYKFLIVKGKWVAYDSSKQNSFLQAICNASNVEVWEHQHDMKTVYSLTDILLFPSQYDEAFGRVVLEAQINSIPIVASKVAGIPFSVGHGGILIEPKDDILAYVETLKELKSNRELYQKISNLALKNALREDLKPEYQVNRFVRYVEKQLKSRTSS